MRRSHAAAEYKAGSNNDILNHDEYFSSLADDKKYGELKRNIKSNYDFVAE